MLLALFRAENLKIIYCLYLIIREDAYMESALRNEIQDYEVVEQQVDAGTIIGNECCLEVSHIISVKVKDEQFNAVLSHSYR